MNNIRQLGVASNLYMTDLGRFPDIVEWLYPKTAPNDMTRGRLYPYLKNKSVYSCPSDKAELERTRPAYATSPNREFSYAFNCMMCHAHDITTVMSPSQTVMFLEATNLPQTGFTMASVSPASLPEFSFALRHNKRAAMVFVDSHVARMNKKQIQAAQESPRFWYPNNQTNRMGTL